jgi:hypothetical protein
MLITIDSIGRVHIVLTETGENALIQPQLITPSTPGRDRDGEVAGRVGAELERCVAHFRSRGLRPTGPNVPWWEQPIPIFMSVRRIGNEYQATYTL